MGICGLLSFPVVWEHVQYSWNGHFFLILLGGVCFGCAGQFFFFQAQHEIESSRLSSLLGLKIIVLSLIYVLCLQRQILPLQWLAVFLCALAAIGMNFTGMRISWKGGLWLFCSLVSYSLSDIFSTELILLVNGDSMIWKSLGGMALSYTCYGFLGSLLIFRTGFRWIWWRDAIPYGICWYLAMVVLFVCFGLVGVIFGNIVQATRGIISVLLGFVLLKLGFQHLEPGVSARIWIRRLLLAVLMVLSMVIYSSSVNA